MSNENLYSVKVPEKLIPPFLKAQGKIEDLFKEIVKNPKEGKITIQDHRYILIRADSLAKGFIEEASQMFGEEAAEMLLYNFAYSIGKNEAAEFIKKFDLKDPVEKLSAGPVYFSFVGLAFVDVFPESHLVGDDSYLLIYEHPNTFESDSYKKDNKKTDHPICFFSAGYSAGWCSEAFGLELKAQEISCVAQGDDSCRFIMAPYDKISEHLDKIDEYKAIKH